MGDSSGSEQAHEQLNMTLVAEVLSDYADFIELTLADMIPGHQVRLHFPKIEDIKRSMNKEKVIVKDLTICLSVDGFYLFSCCGKSPDLTMYRILNWGQAIFTINQETYGEA